MASGGIPARGVFTPLALLVGLSATLLVACSLNRPLPTQTPPVTPLSQSIASGSDVSSANQVLAAPTPTAAELLAKVANRPLQAPWVQSRVNAVSILYRITPNGRGLLQSMEVRQMTGQPGWFGSYGYKGWAGIGEAKPVQVIHELGHTIWGGYPVADQPDLSWEAPADGGLSPAMTSYHNALLEFMRQPADSFEPLRQRFRDLPGLSETNLSPLTHTAEADMVYTVAGSLDLVPPVLRPYWSYMLQSGGLVASDTPLTWDSALSWYDSLNAADRAYADRWTGFAHVDMEPYRGLPTMEDATVSDDTKRIIDNEDEQRLKDFAAQFDLLIAPAEDKDENFGFWRGYVSELMDIHARHPEVLPNAQEPWGPRLAKAFDFLAEVRKQSSDAGARNVADRASKDVTVAYLVPALQNDTLVALFTRYADGLPREASSSGAAAFAANLRRIGPMAQKVIDAPSVGAATELKRQLSALGMPDDTFVADPQVRQKISLFMDLLLQSNREQTARAIQGLSEQDRNVLYIAASATIHFTLTPSQLLTFLGVQESTPLPEMGERMRMLVDYPVGNYRIDRPYYDEALSLIAKRALGTKTLAADPNGALKALRRSGLPIDRFIRAEPAIASAMFSRDPGATADLFLATNQLTTPTANLVHTLAQASPSAAAHVTTRFAQLGHDDVVQQSIASFAYDAAREERYPNQDVSLKATKAYLDALVTLKGKDWLEKQTSALFNSYGALEAKGKGPADFTTNFRRTLAASGHGS